MSSIKSARAVADIDKGLILATVTIAVPPDRVFRAGGLIATINLVRSGRSEDVPIAWISLVASSCWFMVAIGYGATIGNVFDPRVLWHAICALALAAAILKLGFWPWLKGFPGFLRVLAE